MKKLFVCILAAMLLLTGAAMAQVQVETATLDNIPFLSTKTNCYYTHVKDGYQLFDAQGNALSAVYGNLTAKQSGEYYEYYDTSKGLNYIGLLDARGQVISPAQYGQVSCYGDGWTLAFVLERVSGDSGDFKDRDNNWFNAVRTDVYSDGVLLGSLSRDEYVPTYTEGSAGKYFYVKQTSELGFFLDKDFNKYVVNGYLSASTEFDYDYKTKTITHVPTQQKAFTPGCTLTEEDVKCPVWYDENTDSLLDLQGNVIKSGLFFDRVSYCKNGIRIYRNKLSGIMDYQGNIIVEPTYDDITYTYGMFPLGYQAALTPEGHLHYLDRQGNITAKAEYELTSSDYKGYGNNALFACVKNMGKVIVITATNGELAEKYEDYSTPKANHRILRVQKDGLWGAIDTAGNVVVPFIFRSNPDLSDDSTVISGQNENRDYIIYRLTYEEEAAPAQTMQSGQSDAADPVLAPGAWECSCGTINTGKFCGFCGAKKPEPTPTPVPAADGAWNCTCGAVNNGKFCGTCGAKRSEATPAPADNGSWTCACGSHNTGKFCPECGSKKPEAAPQCQNCGYKPEGDAPKFCPECGTKF